MIELRIMLISSIACLGLFGSSASAEPAFVSTLDGCTIGWIGTDASNPAAGPSIVLIQGAGIDVVVNNHREVTQFHCKTQLDWSQPVLAFNTSTGTLMFVNLGSFEDACSLLGFCRNGNAGSVVLDGSSGFGCGTALGRTTDFQLVITPSGQAMLVCRLPERPAG